MERIFLYSFIVLHKLVNFNTIEKNKKPQSHKKLYISDKKYFTLIYFHILKIVCLFFALINLNDHLLNFISTVAPKLNLSQY